MTNSCRLFNTEYGRNYVRQKLKPIEKIVQEDGFEERIEEGQIDRRIASIPAKLDHAAEQLVYKHILDRLKSVYQVSYKNPWLPRHGKEIGKEKTEDEEKDLGSELLAYIHNLYFNPHDEKVLAPPVTMKRLFGYIRPLFLHGNLSMYQDTFGRTAARVIMQEHDKKSATLPKSMETSRNNNTESKIFKTDSCNI